MPSTMSEQDTPKGTERPLTAYNPPLPSNSTPFSFACRCLNVKIDGRVSASDEQKVLSKGEGGTSAQGSVEVFLPIGSEGVVSQARSSDSGDGTLTRLLRNLRIMWFMTKTLYPLERINPVVRSLLRTLLNLHGGNASSVVRGAIVSKIRRRRIQRLKRSGLL